MDKKGEETPRTGIYKSTEHTSSPESNKYHSIPEKQPTRNPDKDRLRSNSKQAVNSYGEKEGDTLNKNPANNIGISSTYPIYAGGETLSDYEKRLDRNKCMATIAEFVPRVEGQTVREYSELIAKIYEKFPMGAGEDDSKYRSRIKTAFENDELYEVIINNLADPFSRVGRTLKAALRYIRKTKYDLANTDMSEENREITERYSRQLKDDLLANVHQAKIEEDKKAHREELKAELANRRNPLLGQLAMFFTNNNK